MKKPSDYVKINVRVRPNLRKRLLKLKKSYRSEGAIVKECIEEHLPIIEARETQSSFNHADSQSGGLPSAA